MKKPDLRGWIHGLSSIYNLKDENAKGRLISLGSGIAAAFYNVFITGIFYTGFLSMYGMSITSVGIISFIPLLASVLCIFSSMVLKHFKRKKPILLASKIFFYAMYIIATTLMPKFVTDPDQRLLWFGIILFLAYGIYALFSPGFTPWFYAFYPSENEPRVRYITLNQTIASITSSLVLILSGIITDAVAGSPHQQTIILGMRYVAFVLVLIDVGMQACAVEHPSPESAGLKLKDVFTLPFHYKKFLYCIVFMFAWNFVANINASVWAYHLLNRLRFSYSLINAMSVMYTCLLILTQSYWKKLLRLYSWIKTFGIATLLFAPTEIFCFCMTSRSTWMYVPICLIQNIMSVGLNLSYANILYINLPEENSTAHIAFYSVGCNIFAFFGNSLGTVIASIGGDTPMMFLGMEIYTVQFNCLLRFVILVAIALVLIKQWKIFTPEADIADIEAGIEAHRHVRKLPFKIRKRIF